MRLIGWCTCQLTRTRFRLISVINLPVECELGNSHNLYIADVKKQVCLYYFRILGISALFPETRVQNHMYYFLNIYFKKYKTLKGKTLANHRLIGQILQSFRQRFPLYGIPCHMGIALRSYVFIILQKLITSLIVLLIPLDIHVQQAQLV